MIVKFVKAIGPHADWKDTYVDAGNREVNCYSVGVEEGENIFECAVARLALDGSIMRMPHGELKTPIRVVVVTVEGMPGVWIGEGGNVYLMNEDGKTVDRP